VLDEAWVAFSHPIFLAMLKEWLKELRKANCAVILATQSLSDAIKSGILDVLVESCPTQIFLPNKKAPQFAETYHQFGLNDKQIELLRHATPKRDYYVCQPTGNRLIDLSLDPIALAFVAAGSKDDIQRIKTLVHEHQESWYITWLTEQGLSFAP
jgi:type IV secretion system protein VirB4